MTDHTSERDRVASGHQTVWECKIGVLGNAALPPGADAPMRQAVRKAFRDLTGIEAEFIFSGWGSRLSESELAVVEDRLPSAALSPSNGGSGE